MYKAHGTITCDYCETSVNDKDYIIIKNENSLMHFCNEKCKFNKKEKNMSELILKFNLPEEQDEANNAVAAGDMLSALLDFKQKLRSKLKYGSYTGKEYELLEEISELFNSNLEENGIHRLFK